MMEHLDITVSPGYGGPMRTTLTIDDDLFAVAKSVAREKSESVGRALSDLARLGLRASTKARHRSKSGFPVFAVPKGAHTITLEDARKLEDEA